MSNEQAVMIIQIDKWSSTDSRRAKVKGHTKLLRPEGVTIDTLPLFSELLIPLGFACFGEV